MEQPTLFLMVGLPATGKTTAARRQPLTWSKDASSRSDCALSSWV
jgi:signal recognition particle GTPase